MTGSQEQERSDAARADLRRLLLTWDWLRIPFTLLSVACLIGFSFIRYGHFPAPVSATWTKVLWTAISANVFYSTFPLFECYVFTVAEEPLGRRRYVLFGLGLGLFLLYICGAM